MLIKYISDTVKIQTVICNLLYTSYWNQKPKPGIIYNSILFMLLLGLLQSDNNEKHVRKWLFFENMLKFLKEKPH